MSNSPNRGQVMTVDGPVDPVVLGPTLTHEHILVDLSPYCEEPDTEAKRRLADAPLTIENLGVARRDPMLIRDNVLIDDHDLAVTELSRFSALGGGTVVDVSTIGLQIEDFSVIADVCRKAELRAVVASGYYIQPSHPDDVADQSVEAIALRFVEEATVGVGDSRIRTGIIGEIGMSQPGHPDEWKILHAACLAQIETGLPLCIHPYMGESSRMAPEVARFILSRGVDPSRVNLCHMDGHMDLDYQRRILDMGMWISFDTYGLEIVFGEAPDHNHTAPDVLRQKHLLALLDLGYADQLLLSQDVCVKLQLQAYGGYGYSHLLENIFPALERRGVENAVLDRIIIDNPRRYLTIG